MQIVMVSVLQDHHLKREINLNEPRSPRRKMTQISWLAGFVYIAVGLTLILFAVWPGLILTK